MFILQSVSNEVRFRYSFEGIFCLHGLLFINYKLNHHFTTTTTEKERRELLRELVVSFTQNAPTD